MCGRFFRYRVSWQDYHRALNLIAPDTDLSLEAEYNIAPTDLAPIVRLTEDGAHREMALAHWGLIPAGWDGPPSTFPYNTINAKAATVATSKAYRNAFQKRRCLVPMSGYYEWSGPRTAKTPYAIGLGNQRWFMCAGLWERLDTEDGPYDSFTLLTTEPNDMLAPIHSRMLVIVEPEKYARWLAPHSGPVDDLYTPFESDAMQAWTVHPDIGNVSSQGAHLIEPYTAPPSAQGDLFG